MADITSELTTIENATYGVQVRTAIHDGLQKVNNNSTDSGWVDVTRASGISVYSSGKFAVRKIGNIVHIIGTSIATSATAASITLGTIPEGYRPEYVWFTSVPYPVLQDNRNVGYISIGTDGVVKLSGRTDGTSITGGMLGFTASYPCA